MPRWRDVKNDGFTLIEVLVSATLLTVAVVALGHVFIASAAANAGSKTVTVATMLASEKLEELRALWFSDPALAISPPSALETDTVGYFDEPSPGYRRRWSVEWLPAHPDEAVVLRVLVTRPKLPGEARLVTIKTRKPPP